MEDIRQYLLSIVAAAIVSALAINMIGKKGIYTTVVKLLAGLFLSITIISPWTKLQLQDLSSYFSDLELDAEDIVSEGEDMAVSATASIIKEQVTAYILDKASSLGLNLEVEVTMTESSPPVPSAVALKGTASPYAKQHLQQIITDELGIPEENQSWI